MISDMTIPQALVKLAHSEFRRKFKLSEDDRRYIEERDMLQIREQAFKMLSTRLFPAYPENDGHQTPLKGHPVFKAMHATATCCRTCFNHWWRVPKGVALTELQQEKVVNLVMAWIVAMMGEGITDHSVDGVEVALPDSAFWKDVK